MLLGAHESVAGGAFHAIARGNADGCEAIQIFARPSAQWRAKPLAPEEVSLFRSEHATVGWPVMSHASYLINLSAGDPVILAKSRDALAEELLRADELGLDFVVLHPGAHLGVGAEAGIVAAADSLSDLYDRTRGVRVRLLLEITAGQGTCLGCRFEEMEAILARARGGHTVGICFDTCHAHASGHDLSTEEGYDRVFGHFARVIGLERLLAFHLNDSKTPAGSHVDRHAEIGDGYLGLLPFWRLVNDARFAATPAVLETPSGPDQLPSFARNLKRLRALIGAPRPPGPPKSQALPEKKDPRQGRLFDLG
ncbi:MAG TPA: deoxyribonuclease IV [Polyangia bacterium]|nr:deoxyribonuclease IV [Polyangia bacterium]